MSSGHSPGDFCTGFCSCGDLFSETDNELSMQHAYPVHQEISDEILPMHYGRTFTRERKKSVKPAQLSSIRDLTQLNVYIILHPFYSMAIGPERRDGRRGVPRRNHFHFAMAEKQYEKVAEAAMAELEGGMCWPVEWFKEDLLEAQCSWTDSQRFLWNLTVFLYGIEFWLAAFGSKRHLFPSNFRRNWTHSWITSRGQLKPKMVLQWTCWSGGLSHEVWGLKSTNVPGRKNSGTGKMIHFLDWFLVPFFSGIWMSIFRGGIWIFIILKKFITILDGSDSLELNWGYRQSLGIDDRRQWSIYPVGICFSLTSKTFVGSSHEVCINLWWSEMIHQRWSQMWSSVHTHIHFCVGGGETHSAGCWDWEDHQSVIPRAQDDGSLCQVPVTGGTRTA